MKKYLRIILGLFLLFSLTSCDTVIAGKECYTYNSVMVKYDNCIIFPEGIYNIETNEVKPLMTLEDKYFSGDDVVSINVNDDYIEMVSVYGKIHSTWKFNFEGKEISHIEEIDPSYNEEDDVGNEFYSSYQRRDWDKSKLNKDQKEIWNYAKSKSLKKEFPYWIEGYYTEKESTILFNVNVYNKIMWKGASLVNQGVVSSTLNEYNKVTGEIKELYFFDGSIIKVYLDDCIYYYCKKDNQLHYYNIETSEDKTISKVKDRYYFFISSDYVIIKELQTLDYTYKLIEIKK